MNTTTMTTSVIQSRLNSAPRGLDRPVGATMSMNMTSRYSPATMITGHPQRPRVNLPSGTQPRARAIPAPITVSRNDR